MKRLDRTPKRDRSHLGFRPFIALLVCLFIGAVLLSYGNDISSPTLSALEVVVLVGGFAAFLASGIPDYRRVKRKNPWRAGFRAVLSNAAVFSILATGGMMIYGVEYGDANVITWSVLLLWISIGLTIVRIMIPRSESIGPGVYDNVKFSISNLSDARRFGLDWPTSDRGIWVGIYSLRIAPSLGTRFLLANVPRDYRIFLAFTAETKNATVKDLKTMLRANADQYEEEFARQGKDEWCTIFVSTRDEAVIKEVFQKLHYYYDTHGDYVFIVAQGDLGQWMDSLKRLVRGERGMEGLTREMIEKSYCVMITEWDHGLEMFTDKILEDDVVRIAKEIATEHSFSLVNLADEQTPKA